MIKPEEHHINKGGKFILSEHREFFKSGISKSNTAHFECMWKRGCSCRKREVNVKKSIHSERGTHNTPDRDRISSSTGRVICRTHA